MGDRIEEEKKTVVVVRRRRMRMGWSWEENKLFELALAVVEEGDPRRWDLVAAMVGGNKTAEEVQTHYVILLQDLEFIESGQLDHHLLLHSSQPPFDPPPPTSTTHIRSICWTDEDHSLLVQVDIN